MPTSIDVLAVTRLVGSLFPTDASVPPAASVGTSNVATKAALDVIVRHAGPFPAGRCAASSSSKPTSAASYSLPPGSSTCPSGGVPDVGMIDVTPVHVVVHGTK